MLPSPGRPQIYEINFSVVVLVAVAMVFFARFLCYRCLRHCMLKSQWVSEWLLQSPKRQNSVIALVTVIALQCLLSELYFRHFRCAVSNEWQSEVRHLSMSAISALEAINVTTWLDFATLLKQLRQAPILSDPDNDFSCMKPAGLGDDQVATWSQKVFGPLGFVSYNPQRELIQLYSPKLAYGRGPHIDVWLWKPSETDRNVIVSHEPTTVFQHRNTSLIFPLKRVHWPEIFREVSIPSDSHQVSFLEYGPGYLHEYTSRADCLHNSLQLRYAYHDELTSYFDLRRLVPGFFISRPLFAVLLYSMCFIALFFALRWLLDRCLGRNSISSPVAIKGLDALYSKATTTCASCTHGSKVV